MKKTHHEIFGLLIFALSVGVTGYLCPESQEPPGVPETTAPVIGDVRQVTVASRIIVLCRRIEIKPQIPEIIEEVYVQLGETFQKGECLAKIRIINAKQEPNTLIQSTTTGTALKILVKEGDIVVEISGFNPGTTVAVIAAQAWTESEKERFRHLVQEGYDDFIAKVAQGYGKSR